MKLIALSIAAATLVASVLCCGGTTAAPVGQSPAPATVKAPAGTPTLSVLTFRDIEEQHKALTDLQWEEYAKGLVGENIVFAGEVIEVYDDARIQIKEGRGLLSVCVLYEVPAERAASLGKGQRVEGEGTVREVNTTLGLAVWVNVTVLR